MKVTANPVLSPYTLTPTYDSVLTRKASREEHHLAAAAAAAAGSATAPRKKREAFSYEAPLLASVTPRKQYFSSLHLPSSHRF